MKDISFDLVSQTRQYKLADAAIRSSEDLVIGVNNYFSNRREPPVIPLIIQPPTELKEKEKIFLRQYRESEYVLENEADQSILTSNLIAHGFASIDKRLQKVDRRLAFLNKRLRLLDDKKPFIEYLKEFATDLGKSYWKVFWSSIGKGFVANPERLAQSHLGMYLKAKFAGAAFVGKEICSGNGFIDIFVHILGIKHIIEIKMLGCTWSFKNAEEGTAQLDRYMHSESEGESFLIIVDGRTTDKGKKLKETYDLTHGRVFVITSKIYWR